MTRAKKEKILAEMKACMEGYDNIDEFLAMFQGSCGSSYQVEVKFEDCEEDTSICGQLIDAKDFSKFINPQSNEFFRFLRFDDHPFRIRKYEIDPIKNKLTLKVRKID
ncbi:MAG: hypothetical protein JXR80_00205 [Deltaproteobacteria bacterium]|nr:hypothetical protein [Deltaproteobacteria bacterium]